jgi:hypothetical protein
VTEASTYGVEWKILPGVAMSFDCLDVVFDTTLEIDFLLM